MENAVRSNCDRLRLFSESAGQPAHSKGWGGDRTAQMRRAEDSPPSHDGCSQAR